MADRTAASIGAAFAAVTIGSATLDWPGPLGTVGPGVEPVVGVIGVVAAAILLGRRHDRLDRRPWGYLAVIAGLVVLCYASVLVATTEGSVGDLSAGPPLAAATGAATAGMALADLRGFDRASVAEATKRVAIGGLLGVGGLAIGALFPVVGLLLAMVALGDVPAILGFTLGIGFFGVGLLVVGSWFLLTTGRGVGFVSFEIPDRWDVAYGLAGVVALIGVAIAVGVLYTMLDVPTADNSIERAARTDGAEVLLAAIPLAWLAIGLGEEYLFRGVIQGYLEEWFESGSAIVLTSGIFALVHIPAYFSPNPGSVVSVLALIFALSLLLGWTYVRTRNILVPIFIHGSYNAIIFLAIYGTLASSLP